MASVTLTDQMGALAFVDDLRHQQLKVQEHLDMPRRRTEVAQRIREYYKSRNTDVSEEIIEAGVREYFDQRLVFEVPEIGKWQAKLASLYIRRAGFKKPLITGLCSLVMLGAVGVFVKHISDGQEARSIERLLGGAQAAREDAVSRLKEQRKLYNDLTQQIEARPLPAGLRILAPVPELIAEAEKKVGSVDLSPHAGIKSEKEAAVANQTAMAAYVGAIDGTIPIAKILDDAQRLITARNDLEGIVAQPSFPQVAKLDNTLPNLVNRAREAIAVADVAGTEKAVGLVGDVREAYANADDVANIHSYRQKFADLGLNTSEMKQVTALIASGLQSMKNRNIHEARNVVEKLDALYAFASTPVTMNIVDRVGTKSGVERNYNASGGKSWYLIVEGVDPAGNVVSVPVVSSETGLKTYAKLFGVRVSNEEYERVKADKKQDGHVDEKLVGEKPANSLTISFERGIGSNPDTILEW